MSYLPSITVLLVFACLVAYEYIRDLRRDLKDERSINREGWRQYERVDRELRTLRNQPLPTESMFGDEQQSDPKKTSSAPFMPTGIGPTAINDRELRREIEQEAKNADPPFASLTVLSPEMDRRPSRAVVQSAINQVVHGKSGDLK